MAWIKLRDQKAIGNVGVYTPDGTVENIKDAYLASDRSALRVTFAATHSGLITRNNGFYLPAKMRDGVKTWTTPHGKPVQVHHRDDQDPIGRVVGAKYVDTVGLLSNDVRDALTTNGISIKDFSDGNSFSFYNQLGVVEELQSLGVLEDPEYKGLGFIAVTADITEREAIEKFLDRRYLTVSVGATTNKAVCSISDCRMDWADSDGPCEHRPGKVYDNQKAFIVAGDLAYDELSPVNSPADPWAAVIEYSINGITDSVQTETSDRVFEVGLTVLPKDHVVSDNEVVITDSHTKEEVKTNKMFLTVKDALKALKLDRDVSPELKDALELDLGSLLEATKLVVEDADKVDEAIEKVKSVFESLKDDVIKDAFLQLKDAEDFTALSFVEYLLEKEAEMLPALEDAAFQELSEDQEVQDAKLSAEQRKKLPDSVFCGDSRSFPAHDCAHVTAARRLVNRAKVSSATKSKILACVDRKAKAMSCDVSKDAVEEAPEVQDAVATQDVFSQATLNALTDSALLSLSKLVRDIMDKRELADNEYLEAVKKADGFEKQVDGLSKELSDSKDNLLEKEETLKILRRELKDAYMDYETSEDRILQINDKYQTLIQTHAVTLKSLSGLHIDDSYKETLQDKSVDELSVELADLTSKVDMVKIVDKLSDGTSRVPIEKVEDPTQDIEESDSTKISDSKESEKPTIKKSEYDKRRRELLKDNNYSALNTLEYYVEHVATLIDDSAQSGKVS